MQLRIISEAGYGRTFSFDYQNASTDKRPRLLLLGKWRHPTTRNILLAGINLNYLTDEQLAEVRKNLKQIITPRNLKSRYWKGKQLLPDVFDDAYRTYDKDYVGSITKDTLKFWPSDAALEKAEKQAQDVEAKKKEVEAKKLGVPAAPAAPGAPAPAGAPTPGEPALGAPAVPGAKPVAPEPGAEPGPKPEATPKGELPGAKAPAAPAPAAGTPRQRRMAKAAPPKVAGAAPTAAPAPTAASTAPASTPVEPEAKPIQPAEAEPKTKATSAQKRKKQAQQIEKAIQRTEPQPKPEPPPEIGGAINMFKGPSPK
jgi:hypothetical protein